MGQWVRFKKKQTHTKQDTYTYLHPSQRCDAGLFRPVSRAVRLTDGAMTSSRRLYQHLIGCRPSAGSLSEEQGRETPLPLLLRSTAICIAVLGTAIQITVEMNDSTMEAFFSLCPATAAHIVPLPLGAILA